MDNLLDNGSHGLFVFGCWLLVVGFGCWLFRVQVQVQWPSPSGY
jgi:hypothetical protein